MKEQNELEHLFSSTFDGFEVTPPSHVKAAIDESLFASKTPVHTKRGFIWLFPLIGFFFIGSFITLSFSTRIHSTKISNDSSTQIANHTSYNSSQNDNTLNNFDNQSVDKEGKQTANTRINVENTKKQHKTTSHKKHQKQLKVSKLNQTKFAAKPNESVKNSGFKSRLVHQTKNANSKNSKPYKTNYKTQRSAKKGNKRDAVSEDKLYDITSQTDPSSEDSVIDEKSAENSAKAGEMIPEEKEKSEVVVSSNENQNSANNSFDTIASNSSSSAGLANSSGATNSTVKTSSKWSLGLYAGTLLGFNSMSSNTTNNFEINSPAGFSSSIEVNYGLTNKWSITTGLGYSTFNERISGVIYDTTFIPNGVTVEYIYLNPALQDSIIDSIVTVNYISEIASFEASQKINYNVFSLPIYGSFTLFNKGNWSSLLMAGVRLNYCKTTVTNYYEGTPEALISSPQIKQFGISAALRPEITYAFGKFGLGVYLNTSFDLIPITRWTEFDKKRFDFGGGAVLKYRF